MKVKFPDLKVNQVALLRAEALTGHVLDELLNLAVNENQRIYTIFEDVDMALLFARKLVNDVKTVECVLYGQNETFLHFIAPDNS